MASETTHTFKVAGWELQVIETEDRTFFFAWDPEGYQAANGEAHDDPAEFIGFLRQLQETTQGATQEATA